MDNLRWWRKYKGDQSGEAAVRDRHYPPEQTLWGQSAAESQQTSAFPDSPANFTHSIHAHTNILKQFMDLFNKNQKFIQQKQLFP